MSNTRLWALSPLDGKYQNKVSQLQQYFSEAALIKYRVRIEIKYLIKLSQLKIIRFFSKKEIQLLNEILELNNKDLKRVKKIEAKTHHDVKAIEYFIREKIEKTSLKDMSSFIHFALTSEDINNLAYRLMCKSALEKIMLPELRLVLKNISIFAEQNKKIVMLARTHGQAAIPTTLGKEFSVFAVRLLKIMKQLTRFKFDGKLNGAVGAYHAMFVAYPKINWLKFSKEFIEDLHLNFIANTTQINPNDDLTELFSLMHRINSVFLDFDQDIWRYISDDWLVQLGKENHVGSSTMPQKINPIEFENSEGNIVLANVLFEAFMNKLPVSRLQRDLSASTISRNYGLAFAHCLLSYKNFLKGLKSIAPNQKKMEMDLNKNWNILAEALQTVARKKGDIQAYEKVAAFSKKRVINQTDWQNMSQEVDKSLLSLTPSNYLGLCEKLTKKTIRDINNFLKKGA
ncbi:MAG: adenylosuccinate lyase [Candidatus Woesebacteria bacterium]|jgi:adenylosuccinate lyase